MKNLVVVASLVSSLSLVNACGKNEKDSDHSALAGDSRNTLGGVNFNLGEHLKKAGVRSEEFITIDAAGLSLGNEANFLVVNNFTVGSKTQKITAQYYTDLTILDKKLPGHAIDLTAVAKSDKIEAAVNFRILGQSLYSVK